jgi:hypothetical protein
MAAIISIQAGLNMGLLRPIVTGHERFIKGC